MAIVAVRSSGAICRLSGDLLHHPAILNPKLVSLVSCHQMPAQEESSRLRNAGRGCARSPGCNLAQTQLLNDVGDFTRVRHDENNLIAGHEIAVLADLGNLIEDVRRYGQERDVCGHALAYLDIG